METFSIRGVNIDDLRIKAKSMGLKINKILKFGKGTHLALECEHGHEYVQRLDAFKKSIGCKYCNNYVKYTYKQVKEYVDGTGHELLSTEYIGIDEKLDIKCPDGHVFNITFHNFLHNHSRCPICKGGVVFSYEYVKEYIESKGSKLLSSTYTNANTKLEIECINGHIHHQTFSAFQRGTGCCYCDNSSRKLTYEFVKEYIESFGYKLLSDTYINTNSHLLVMCNKGHTYKVSFHNFKAGYRCPVCNGSKGEDMVGKVLKTMNLEHFAQYRFKDCRHKNTLPFDFYIPSLNACIEYDGQQHFEPVEYFGGMKSFKDTQLRDEIKNAYCRDKSIQLIRIPYFEFENIEDILKEKLNP